MEEIITKVQALQTADDAALADIVTALQAIVPAAPAADPVVSITVTTQSGAVTEFVPKA
jgi:hypothetical protein